MVGTIALNNLVLKAKDVEVTPHRAKYEDWESEDGYFQVRVADEMKEVSFKSDVLIKKEDLLLKLNGKVVLAKSGMFKPFYCVVTTQSYEVPAGELWAEYNITLRETTKADPIAPKKEPLLSKNKGGKETTPKTAKEANLKINIKITEMVPGLAGKKGYEALKILYEWLDSKLGSRSFSNSEFTTFPSGSEGQMIGDYNAVMKKIKTLGHWNSNCVTSNGTLAIAARQLGFQTYTQTASCPGFQPNHHKNAVIIINNVNIVGDLTCKELNEIK
jgi:hypothetical protein